MIAFAAECLLFQLSNGEKVPVSPEMISVELMGHCATWFEPEFVRHAANAVFYYFRMELGRETVTVAEFAQALERVLRGIHLDTPPAAPALPTADLGVRESDLCRLARESGQGCELFFFPRLRDELRQQMQHSPRIVRFSGLRGCVKELVGTQRWNVRCRSLEAQIVTYLRECLNAEPHQSEVALVVE